MEILKLTLLALAILIIVVGMFMLFTLWAGKRRVETQGENCDSENNSPTLGCGCGSGFCGLPVNPDEGQ